MYNFDFLSESPKLLIFQKKSKKNSFGGVLTIIYLIIVILIAIIYIYDYSKNSKYSIIYTYEHEYLSDDETIKKINEDEKLNPYITYNVKINDKNESNFILLNVNLQNMNFNYDYKTHAKNLVLAIGYKCAEFENKITNNTNNICTIREEDKKFNGFNIYSVTLNYTSSKINHQNEISPLESIYIQEKYFFNFNLNDSDKMIIQLLNWKTIKYTEEKGMFEKYLYKNSTEFYGGEYILDRTLETDIPNDMLIALNMLRIKVLAVIIIFNQNQIYSDCYIRTKKSIFDSISDICSLSLTFYSIFVFILDLLYSDNFNNYVITQNILDKNKKNQKLLHLNNKSTSQIGDIIELSKINNIDNDNSDNIIYKERTKKSMDNLNYKNKKAKKNNKELFPKFYFYDFLANNFYFKQYCSSNKQEIISLCNNIISKYYSIEYIIYNQMKLENLFKDYKWNNPELKDIYNNNSLYYIKNNL